MMQQSQEKSVAANAGVSPEVKNADLKGSAMPVTDRTNLLSRAVSGAALSAALVTNGVPAQAQTNAPTEPTPKVAPAVPGATNEIQARFTMLDNFTAQLQEDNNRRAGVTNVVAATNTAATTQTVVIPSNAQPTNAPTYQVVDPAVVQQFISTQVPQGGNPPAAPAPAPTRDVFRSNITFLEKRPFCMTDTGKVLFIRDRESQVKRPGSFVQDTPSTGTVLQALSYAKEHLLEMNGGKIPDGYKANLYIRSGGGVSRYELNLNAIPAVANLGEGSHAMALNDPLTDQAIQNARRLMNVRVVNDGGAFTMTFKSKGNQPTLLTVELEK